MRINFLKTDNLVKLLDGLSLLDNREQEQIISVVDILNFAEKKVERVMLTGIPLTRTEKKGAIT
jgi:hypothetical protein